MSSNPKTELEEKLETYVGIDIGPPWVAQVKVNDAMIHHYCAVTGDRNPVYFDAEVANQSVHGGIVAPPSPKGPRWPARSSSRIRARRPPSRSRA